MFFDTHTHIDAPQFDYDRDETIARAVDEQVSCILNVGYNHHTIQSSLALAEQYDFIYTAVGWHPHDALTLTDKELLWLRKLAQHPKVVALGEMGLDYYRDYAPKEIQLEVFRSQIGLALEVDLPIIIHSRDADEDVLRVLEEHSAYKVGGVMHCFGGDLSIMERALSLNFCIGLGGPVTFKNAHNVKEIALKVPLNMLFIETDCPYLAPHPHRGKRNEPAYVKLVAAEIARIRGCTIEKIAEMTMSNAKRVFSKLK